MTLIVQQPSTTLQLSKPVALAIGAFDGVHTGHQAVLQRLTAEAQKRETTAAVVTYVNHPSELLQAQPTALLCSLPHKLHLLQHYAELSHLLLFYFDRAFASQSPAVFLERLMHILPFSYLNMGYDGKLGHGRAGDRDALVELGKRMHFEVEYMPAYRIDTLEVSSTRLRQLIQKGEFAAAQNLLGRPYSIFGPVIHGAGRGSTIGFPTANISVAGLVLPPQGVYAVTVKTADGTWYRGAANLGKAPTLHTDRHPLLEVHLLDYSGDLYDTTIEVVFAKFIRSERQFLSLDELCEQIRHDLHEARTVTENFQC
jgi:riboflavin kinase/FMN adenylyltransferase